MKWLLVYLFIMISIPSSIFSQTIHIKKTTSKDIIETQLCIYNDNLGLIKETRQIILPAGYSELRFLDISHKIKPSTVMITSLDRIKGLNILEQSYEYDLISPEKLMDKYVGKEIKLIKENKETGEEEVVEAELISNNKGFIYRIGDQIHIGHPGRVVLPKIPDDLIEKPTLVWMINTQEEGRYPIEVSYLTEGLNWEMDYSIILNTEETRGDMSGWITIQNKTGTSFNKANIQLVAGSVNRVFRPQLRRMKGIDMYMDTQKSVSEEDLFEYHLYNIPGEITIKENQTKQIKFLTADRTPIKKELRYYGHEYFYHNRYNKIDDPQRVGVYLEFENKKTYHLGIPLPEGTIRAYKKDSQGRIQFLGEDRISHIPEDEKARIQMGYAFDIVVERKQMDWRKISSDIIEVVWEISLRNHKTESAWVVVLEPMPGDWEVLEKSHHGKKEDAHTLRFDVSITPGAEEKIRYKARVVL